MYAHTQDLKSARTQNLRREAGRWLAELRNKAELSQRELADAIGSEFYTFISQIENGKALGKPALWRALADALKVTVDDILPLD